MIFFIRKCLAAISACGFAAGVLLYVASYTGMTMDGAFRWAISLHIGVFILMLLMYVVEYPSFTSRVFFWKEFGRGMPKWVVPAIKGLAVFFALHFALFLVQSHAAAPEVRNGEYFI